MVLSRFRLANVEQRVIWAPDDFVQGRGALRVTLLLDDGTPLHAFSVHLPALKKAKQARVHWMLAFKSWSSSFPGPQIVGGDFNEGPGEAAVSAMTAGYTNAWSAKGSGDGATHARDNATYTSRLDYLFSSGGLRVESAFVGQVKISDHRPVVADYAVTPKPTVSPASPQGPEPLRINASHAEATRADSTINTIAELRTGTPRRRTTHCRRRDGQTACNRPARAGGGRSTGCDGPDLYL